jgi:dihydroorotate dehydrogenase (fumarate)
MSTTDLETRYLGLHLRNPFVVGASPLGDTVHGARLLEDMGAAAIVVRSLFSEQVMSHCLPRERSVGPRVAPLPSRCPFDPDDYVEHVGRLKQALGIPVIASLNADGPGSWLDYPPLLEEAGADAIELNLYCAGVSPSRSGAEIEESLLRAVAELRHAVRVPIAVKITPFFSSLAHFARGAQSAGAAALVLFNRSFPGTTDVAHLHHRHAASCASELSLSLGWAAALSSELDVDLAVTGGVRTGQDAGRAILAGAHVVQVVTPVLQHGPERLAALVTELERWLAVGDRISVAGCRGRMNLDLCADPAGYERAQYIVSLQNGWPAPSELRAKGQAGATRRA